MNSFWNWFQNFAAGNYANFGGRTYQRISPTQFIIGPGNGVGIARHQRINTRRKGNLFTVIPGYFANVKAGKFTKL